MKKYAEFPDGVTKRYANMKLWRTVTKNMKKYVIVIAIRYQNQRKS